mmetsp:Transcript_13720/g.32641  ORF Transcript_13720/g.32641 Transcript_13720/m.32641 type:complete len:300 (+) Transcript_13720:284-1183(+)
MKVLKSTTGLAEVSVPQSHNAWQGEFSQQQTIHPLESELKEFNTSLPEVLGKIGIDPGHELLQSHHHPLDAGLICRVVILNAGEEIGQAPVRIGLHLKQLVVGDVVHNFALEDVVIIVAVGTEKDRYQRCGQVVDALDVAAGRVAAGPNVQQPAEGLSQPIVPKERNVGSRTGHIHQHLAEGLLLLHGASVVINVVVRRNCIAIFRSLPFQRLFPPGGIGRKISQQNLPRLRPMFAWDSIPRQPAKIAHHHHGSIDCFLECCIFVRLFLLWLGPWRTLILFTDYSCCMCLFFWRHSTSI